MRAVIQAAVRPGGGGADSGAIGDDDNASDPRASRAEAAGPRHGLDLRVLRLPKNRGKGYAVRTGCLEAAGRLILVSDADFSTPIYEWAKLPPAAGPGAL